MFELDSENAADRLLGMVKPPGGGYALVVAGVDSTALRESEPGRYFEAGSLTKTFVGTLLAALVIDAVVRLDDRVASYIAASEAIGSVTLRELATHTSGLERLPADAMSFPFWPRDPYRFYNRTKFTRHLQDAGLRDPGQWRYSNIGFDLLGLCLERATGAALKDLLHDCVFAPLGMAAARCQPCSGSRMARAQGSLLTGGRRWHQPIPGAGGIDLTGSDLASWVSAQAFPSRTSLSDAIELAQEVHYADGSRSMGLGWIHAKSGTRWHDGATGRYQSLVVVCEKRGAFGVMVGHGRTRNFWLTSHVADWFEN